MAFNRRALVWSCLLCTCLPIVAAGREPHAVCDAVLPQMRQSHIQNLALASFADGEVHTYYCASGTHLLRPEAIFEAASLGKPIFAAAVLTLVQNGKLDLDGPLAAYLPGPYQHQQNPFHGGAVDTIADRRYERVTARMVLSHTSGLPNWSRHQPLTFLADPGQKWSYSGEGYVLLQRVVETISGASLQDFVQRSVFAPLGMTHSSFIWRPDFATTALSPHAADGSAKESEQYPNAVAPSTLYTTLDDYGKFVSALLHPQPGSVFATEETKQVEVNTAMRLAWGLGAAIEDTPRKAYFHWGSNPGFQSFFMIQPASGRGVLFLSDSANGLDLVDTLVARFIPGKHPVLRFPMLHPKN
jgi:CubicO group peptidase (beta-lactamase class C family)